VSFELPVVPASPGSPASCSLDAAGLSQQLARYRELGEGASVLTRSRRRVVVRLRDSVSSEAVAEAVEVERSCCPFFDLSWSACDRELSFGVLDAEHEPALDAIAYALGLEGSVSASPGVKP
jgi:hypothetical protein